MKLSKKKLECLTDRAKTLSDKCEGRCLHVSFILERNKVLAEGWNLMGKTDAFARRSGFKFPYVHSELAAIRNFKYKPAALRGKTLVNIRVSRDKKNLLMARPCKSCSRLIEFFGFGSLFYSTKEGFFHESQTPRNLC